MISQWLYQWRVSPDGYSSFVHGASRHLGRPARLELPRFPEKPRRAGHLSQIFVMDDQAGRRAGLAAAVAALARGALVAMPTETVYGLAADATSPAAVAGIFAAKGRPRFNPLIVHVPSRRRRAGREFCTSRARRLADAFWPGPLTLVAAATRRGAAIADLVTAGLDTIAIRVPGHPVAQAASPGLWPARSLPRAPTAPATSARPPPRTSPADLGEQVAVILDAGADAGRPRIDHRRLGRRDCPCCFVPAASPRADRSGARPDAGISRCRRGCAARAGHARLALCAGRGTPPRLPTEVRPGRSVARLRRRALPGNARNAVAHPQSQRVRRPRRGCGQSLRRAPRARRCRRRTIAVMPIPDQGLGEAINDRLRRAAAPRS